MSIRLFLILDLLKMILYFPNRISTTWGNYWEYVVFFGGSLGKSKSFCSIHPYIYIDNWSNASQEVEGMPLCKNVEFMRSTCSENLLELVLIPQDKHIYHIFYLPRYQSPFIVLSVSHHGACRSPANVTCQECVSSWAKTEMTQMAPETPKSRLLRRVSWRCFVGFAYGPFYDLATKMGMSWCHV